MAGFSLLNISGKTTQKETQFKVFQNVWYLPPLRSRLPFHYLLGWGRYLVVVLVVVTVPRLTPPAMKWGAMNVIGEWHLLSWIQKTQGVLSQGGEYILISLWNFPFLTATRCHKNSKIKLIHLPYSPGYIDIMD
jgi:hypothetical protein